MKLPRAILFDLDDTILVTFGPAQSQWRRTIAAFADQLGPIEATVIAEAIEAASTELWGRSGGAQAATTLNGRSWHPNGWAFTRSGTIVTGLATSQFPDPP